MNTNPSKNAGRKILLVDDQADVREAIALLLSVDNHEVTQAESGQAALERLQSDPSAFELMITDHRMTGMNGDELAQKVSALYPGLPMIMLTGFAPCAPGPDNPVKEIVQKPVDFLELRAAVQRVLA